MNIDSNINSLTTIGRDRVTINKNTPISDKTTTPPITPPSSSVTNQVEQRISKQASEQQQVNSQQSLLQVKEAGLTALAEQLTSASQLFEQNRQPIDSKGSISTTNEQQQLLNEINRISEQTRFNGEPVLIGLTQNTLDDTNTRFVDLDLNSAEQISSAQKLISQELNNTNEQQLTAINNNTSIDNLSSNDALNLAQANAQQMQAESNRALSSINAIDQQSVLALLQQ